MSDENAPEFHDRFSIHPESVERCREALRRAGATDEKVDALSDWEAVQLVENADRCLRDFVRARQKMNRAAKGTAARFSELHEALMPLAAENAARELEAFLAVDHSD